MKFGKASAAAGAVLALDLAWAVCAPAHAQTPPATPAERSVVPGPRQGPGPGAAGLPGLPPAGRYVAEGQAFILDPTAPAVLMLLEGSNEVVVLIPRPAPRGDWVFFNDVNQQVLRVTRFGGMTVFTQTRPAGAPAQRVAGPARPLNVPPPMTMQAFTRKMREAGVRIANSLGREIGLDVTANERTGAIIAEAASLTADAVQAVAGREGGAALLAKIRGVQFKEGPGPAAALVEQGVLRVTYNPRLGVAGRPSSERIAKVLSGQP